MAKRNLQSIRGVSSDLAKGVLKEIAPGALADFGRVERSVFEGTYGLPENLEFAAALLYGIAQAFNHIQEEAILSATAPEEVAELMVKEVLALVSTRPGKVKEGFETYFKQNPSAVDLIFGAFLPPFKVRGDAPDPLNRLEAGVLKVTDRQGRISTAFALCEEGHVLTARHVVQGQDRIEVSFKDQEQAWAEVIHSDQNRDIAILQISPNDWQRLRGVGLVPLPLSLTWQPRDWVLCLGYQEQDIFADPVSVEAFIKPHDSIHRIRFRDGYEQRCLLLVIPRDYPHIAPGMSGGPVLDLRTGRVIGMVTGATREAWVRQRWRNEEIWELISGIYGFATPLSDVADSWPAFKECCIKEGE